VKKLFCFEVFVFLLGFCGGLPRAVVAQVVQQQVKPGVVRAQALLHVVVLSSSRSPLLQRPADAAQAYNPKPAAAVFCVLHAPLLALRMHHLLDVVRRRVEQDLAVVKRPMTRTHHQLVRAREEVAHGEQRHLNSRRHLHMIAVVDAVRPQVLADEEHGVQRALHQVSLRNGCGCKRAHLEGCLKSRGKLLEVRRVVPKGCEQRGKILSFGLSSNNPCKFFQNVSIFSISLAEM